MANGDDSGYDSGDNSGEELFSEGEILDTVEQLQTKYGSNVTYNGRYYIASSDSDTSTDIESTTDNSFIVLKNSSKPTNALNTSTSKNKGKSVSKPPLPTLSNSKNHSISISPSSLGSVTPYKQVKCRL